MQCDKCYPFLWAPSSPRHQNQRPCGKQFFHREVVMPRLHLSGLSLPSHSAWCQFFLAGRKTCPRLRVKQQEPALLSFFVQQRRLIVTTKGEHRKKVLSLQSDFTTWVLDDE